MAIVYTTSIKIEQQQGCTGENGRVSNYYTKRPFHQTCFGKEQHFFMRKVSDDSYKLATEQMYYNNFDSNVYVKNANIEWR